MFATCLNFIFNTGKFGAEEKAQVIEQMSSMCKALVQSLVLQWLGKGTALVYLCEPHAPILQTAVQCWA